MTLHPAQWLAAFFIAITLHLAVLLLVVTPSTSPTTLAAKSQGITVSLSNPGGVSDAVATSPQPAAEVIVPEPVNNMSPPTPQTANPTPARARPVDATAPEPSSANSVEVPVAEAPSAVAASEPERAQTPADTKRRASTPAADKITTESPKPARNEDVAVGQPSRTVDARRATAQSDTARPAASKAGAASAKSYGRAIRRALAAYKTYPSEARRQDIQGQVWIRLIIDDSGDLIRASLAQSSGSEILDQAALEAVKKAAPFEPIPISMVRSRIEYTVPYNYTLNR